MAEVFICYSRADRDQVAAIARLLEAQGHRVSWTPAPGSSASLPENTIRKLKQADGIIVIWSRSSIRSNWVVEEARDALERGLLVEIQISGTSQEVPLDGGARAFELVGWTGDLDDSRWRSILARIDRIIYRTDRLPSGRQAEGRRGNTLTAWIIYILFLGWVVGGAIGLVLAYASRKDAPGWLKTHYTFQIHTYWKYLLYLAISLALTPFLIGLLVWIAGIVWWVTRIHVGTDALLKRKPITDPTRWGF